jgi:hypothetical protein
MSESFLNISADLEEVQEALAGTSRSIPSIQKSVLRLIGRNTAGEVNKALRGSVKAKANSILAGKYEHNLRSAFKSTVKKNGQTVSVYPRPIQGGGSLILPVITTLNYGAVINAKGSYLIFKTKDGWRKVKSVRITGRHFIEKGDAYVNSDKYKSDVEALINKELNKYWG